MRSFNQCYSFREKEQNEKFLKHIEEEAENQLLIASDRIKNEVFLTILIIALVI